MLRNQNAQRTTAGAWAALMLLSTLGCGDDAGPSTQPEPVGDTCAPNTSSSCVGPNQCSGVQLCFSDGKTRSACECNLAVAGSGAGAGTAGVGAGNAGVGASGSGGALADDAGALTDASVQDAATPQDSCDGNRTCIDAPPSGFEGPIALDVGSAAPPKCTAAFAAKAFEAGDDPSGAAASCESCECTPAAGSCESFVNFSTGAAAACGGTTCTTSVSSSCVEIEPPCVAGLGTAYLKTKLPNAASTCEPSEQHATLSKAKFDTRVLGCALDGDAERLDCKKDELCAPKDTGAKFEDALCVWKAGDVACPSGVYSDKRVYARELVDTRKCSACSCSGPNCSYAWKVFAAGDTTCTSPIITLTSAEQCVQVNPSSNKVRVGVAISGNGACTPNGGAAQGSVSGGDPITVCCAED